MLSTQIWMQALACVSLSEVLPAVCPLVSQWLCLSMANPKVPLDPSLLLLAHHSKVCVEDYAQQLSLVPTC